MSSSYCANTLLTIIIIVDSHVSGCCVHDLIRLCRQGFLLAQRQQVALFLELSNQLQGQAKEAGLNVSRDTLQVSVHLSSVIDLFPKEACGTKCKTTRFTSMFVVGDQVFRHFSLFIVSGNLPAHNNP